MNRERLIKLRDFLKEHPDRFKYDSWIVNLEKPGFMMPHPDDLVKDQEKSRDCGTVGCVAGWAVALFADARQKKAVEDDDDSLCFDDCATHLLGLDWRMRDRLFLNHIGPDRKPYGVDEAIRRIDELLKTGTITLQSLSV